MLNQKYAAKEASEMEVYQIESQIVEQRKILEKVAVYVREQAMSKPLHEVEQDLFSLMLTPWIEFSQRGHPGNERVGTRYSDVHLETDARDDKPLLVNPRQFLQRFLPLQRLKRNLRLECRAEFLLHRSVLQNWILHHPSFYLKHLSSFGEPPPPHTQNPKKG